MPRFRLRLLPFLLATLCLTAGCASLSVGHLNRQPWTLDADQSLEMNFWRFRYEILPVGDGFGVRGTALLREDRIPPDMTRVEELWLSTYLSDESGEVLAKDLRVFLPRTLVPGQGVDFEFLLRPEEQASGRLYISFGYRTVLTGADKSTRPFFASEGAVSR